MCGRDSRAGGAVPLLSCSDPGINKKFVEIVREITAPNFFKAFKFGAPEGQRPELGYIPGLNMHAHNFSSKITPRY